MGNGRKRRRLERSPRSSSPSTAPSRRRRLGGETCVTEEEGRTGTGTETETEVIRVERQREQTGVVEIETTKVDEERPKGGDGAETEKETHETMQGMYRVMGSLWDTLSNEEKHWSASPAELQKFARDKLKNPLLAELVVHMINFHQIHRKLQFWFCPLCRCYFGDGDSLTMHLKEHHFPMIREFQAWLLPYQRDLKFASVQEAICKMVWKPIDVRRAVQQFYTLCLDSELEAAMDSQGELGWPVSDDDSQRSQLLLDLGRELTTLALHKTGLFFLSSGLLQHLITVASWHILIRLPSRDHMLHFTRKLVCSPLSFRFLDTDALCHFIRVAKRVSQLARNEDTDCNSDAACISNEVSLCQMSEKVSPDFRISKLMPGCIHFFLKPADGHYQSLRSWLHDKLSDILCSGPLQVSSHTPPFLTNISVLSGACRQLTEIMGEIISCLNESEVPSAVPRRAYYSIVNKWLREALVEKECSVLENRQFADCLFKPSLEMIRDEFLAKADMLSLRFVELFTVLESWEFRVSRLCTFDFRSFLLPLMQSFLQLDNLDVQLMQELAQIDMLKREISDLCFCDYSTYILPFIGVFLNPRIKFNAGIRYWANNRLQELLLSIDQSDLSNKPANFRITSVSIGKVLLNITASKWGLGFDYRGMRLNFEGEWSFLLQEKRANGYIDLAGSSDWHSSRKEHIQAKSEVALFTGGMEQNTEDLAPSLKEAVCAKLLKFQREFVKKSAPKIPTRWYVGDRFLPFPNKPFHGEGPMTNMKADCLEHATSEFHRLIQWQWMQWRRDIYNL